MAAAVAVGVGGTAGIGVAIGISVARNFIGADLVGAPAPLEVRAFSTDTSIAADGDLTLSATATQSITSLVIAAAAAIAAGGSAGIGVAGSGVFAENIIRAHMKAVIDGDGPSGISARAITVSADDRSRITSLAGAVSVAAAFAGGAAVAVAVGVSLARNVIDNEVEAAILNAGDAANPVTADSVEVTASEVASIHGISFAASVAIGAGVVGIAVSGAGAQATNIILTRTNAHIDSSVIDSAGDVTISAADTSTIKALILAVAVAVGAGTVGVGVAIGLSLAENMIGLNPNGATAFNYRSGDNVLVLNPGDRVKINAGIRGGDVYRYLGPTLDLAAEAAHSSADGVVSVGQGELVLVGASVYEFLLADATLNLGAEDFTDAGRWRQITALQQDYGDAALWERADLDPAATQVRAYVLDSSIDAEGALVITATEQAAIDAIVIAAAVAVSAGVVGASLSGAGAAATNRISTQVQAFIDGDGTTGISALSVTITATDSSGISAIAGAAAVAAGFGVVGAALSIAVTIAYNEVDNDVDAYVANADQGVSTTGGAMKVAASTAGLVVGELDAVEFTPTKLDDAATATPDDPDTTKDEAKLDREGDPLVPGDVGDHDILSAVGTALGLSTVNTVSSSWKYTTEDGSVDLETGDLVRVAKGYEGGGVGGAVYEYTGGDGSVDLGAQNYDVGNWKPFVATPKLSVLVEGEQWVLAAPDGATFVLTYDADNDKVKVSRATISVVAFAASVAVGGGLVGVGIAGAGAVAQNVVLSTTNAAIESSKIDTVGGGVNVEAATSSAITATILSVSLGVGGGLVGGGVAIGVAISRNYIGWQLDGTPSPAEVGATITNSTVSSTGALQVRATNGAQISALVFSAAVAIGVGGYAGIGAAGSGVSADNRINTHVRATIDGDSALGVARAGISAATVTLSAEDVSTISAFTGAVAIAFATGVVGAAVSVGVSISSNQISNQVEASISNAVHGVTAAIGAVSITATSRSVISAITAAAAVALAGGLVALSVSGAGAESTNIILTETRAFIVNSAVTATNGDISVSAVDTSSIRALVIAASVALAAGLVGGGASFGVSLAQNLIGWGAGAGGLTEMPVVVHAYSINSILNASGDLRLEAVSDAEIEALVLAISVAISVGAGAVALTGAGSTADNRVSTSVHAYLEGGNLSSGAPADVSAQTLAVTARDTSRIRSSVAAGSVGIAGGAVGLTVSIAVSIARNLVSNDVAAYLSSITIDRAKVQNIDIDASSGLEPAPAVVAGLAAKLEAAIVPDTGILNLTASAAVRNALPALGLSERLAVTRLDDTEWTLRDLRSGIGYRIVERPDGRFEISRITIDAVSVAASVAAAVTGVAGVAGSGAGAVAVNTVLSRTNAYIVDSSVGASGDISIDASSTSSIAATIVSVSVAIGVGAFGGAAVSVGVAIARNEVGFGNGNGQPITHRMSDSDGAVFVTVSAGQTVLIDGGPNVGRVYEYIGRAPRSANLLVERYDDTRLWRELVTRRPVEVQAYLLRSTTDVEGALTATASSAQSIASIVVAGSASLSASGGVGVSGSGAGGSARNAIATQVRAFVQDASTPGVRAGSIALTAQDVSTIKADVGAGSFAGAIGFGAGIAVSIAIALAENEVVNTVEAYTSSSALVARGGSITIRAHEDASITALVVSASVALAIGLGGISVSGAGAAADNLIRNRVAAYGSSSSLTTQTAAGNVELTAESISRIHALVVAVSAAVAAGAFGAAGAIGVSTARNRIGLDYDYSSDEFVDPFTGLATQALLFGGDLVRVAPGHAAGGEVGRVYRYLGPFNLANQLSDPVNLSGENFEDTDRWALVPLASGASVEATLTNSSVSAGGDLLLKATADQVIQATTAAAAAAVAAGVVGVGASGAGSSATNVSAASVTAGIFGVAAGGVVANSIQILAMDASSITSTTIAAAVAISFAPIGAAIAVAVAEARNVIRNDVLATIDVSPGAVVRASGGSVTVTALSTSQQIMDGPVALDLATKGISAAMLDLGTATPLLPAALGSAAPLTGTLSLFTITTGSRWQIVSEDGPTYIIERDGTHLFVRRASITAYTLAAAVSGGLVALSVSGASATNLYSTSTRARIAGGGIVEAFSRIDVSASDTVSVTSYLPSVSVSIGAIAAAVAASVTRNIVRNGVEAYLGVVTLRPCTGKVSDQACNGATAPDAATDGGILVNADSVIVVHAGTFVVAITIGLGGAAAVSYARSFVGGTVRASTGATIIEGPAALVTIRSSSTVAASGTMRTGAGAVGVAVASSDGNVLVADVVEAFVGEGATLTIRALTVDAKRQVNATAGMSSGAGAFLAAVTGGSAIAESRGRVDAYIGPAAPTPGAVPTTIIASGEIRVASTSSEVAGATGGGGQGAGISVASLSVEARSLGTTRAYIGDAVNIRSAGGLSVDAEVLGASAQTSLVFASGGLVDIKSVRVRSRSKPIVAAWIGDAVVIGGLSGSPVGIAGDVVVSATGRSEADAVGRVFGGGLIAVGVPSALIEVDPTVDAFVGTPDAPTPTVIYTLGSVIVRAELTRAGAVDPSDSVTVFSLTGETLSFTYPGIGEGNSVTYSAAAPAGGLRNGEKYTVLDAGTDLIRLGSVVDLSGIDPLTETIRFEGGHPYQSGDCVYYDPSGSGSILSPWQSSLQATSDAGHPCLNETADSTDRVFYVRRIDDNTIKLTTTYGAAVASTETPFVVTVADPTHLEFASLPSGIAVDTALVYRSPLSVDFSSGVVDVTVVDLTIDPPDGDPYTVKAPQTGPCPSDASSPGADFPTCGWTLHNDAADNIFIGETEYSKLTTGQAVQYTNLSGTSIGLANGTYYVIKRPNFAIQLAASYCLAVGTAGDPTSCPATPAGPPGPAGDIPISVTPLTLSIIGPAGTDGNVTNGSADFSTASASFVADDVGKTIRIAGVLYRIASVSGTASIGLDRVYAGLTTSSASWQVYDDGDSHLLDASFGGLVSGRTYYVKSVDAGNDRIELTDVRGGTTAITLTATPSTHRVGFVQVDLDPASVVGTQALFVNLTSSGGTSQRLLAPSGESLNSIAPPPGDGRSTATSQGGQGGLGEFTFPEARAIGSPSVSATLGAGRIQAGTDITLEAISAFDVSASADTDGGGGISVGKSISSVNMGDASTTANVEGSSTLTAAGSITIRSTSNHKLVSTARAVGGGAISAKIAYTQATVDNDTVVNIGSGVDIEAGGAIQVHADAKTTASTSSETLSIGIGAGADSDNTNGSTRGVRIGSLADAATTTVNVGSGTDILGRTVDLDARASFDAKARAKAEGYSVIFFSVATAFADAEVDIDSDVGVNVAGINPVSGDRTIIRGLEGVDVEAQHVSTAIVRDAFARAVALIPPQGSRGLGRANLDASVDLDPGVTVVVGVRRSAVGGLIGTPDADLQLALYAQASNAATANGATIGKSCVFTNGDRRCGVIVWDADVIVLGGMEGSPLLVVDSVGNVVKQNALTIVKSGTTITVNDIINSGYGDILFEADDTIDNGGGAPVFDWRDTLATVTIVDHSAGLLIINKIDVVNDLAATSGALVRLRPNEGAGSTLRGKATIEFDVRHSAAPSLVDIQKWGDGDLVLNKLINNPAGLTRTLANRKNIVANAGALIITNIADVEATLGSVGTASNGLSIDLVQFVERPRVDGPSVPTLRRPVLLGLAGDDLHLSLRGRDRVPTGSPLAPTAFVLAIDRLVGGADADPGGSVDVVLRDNAREGSTTLTADVSVQVVLEASAWATPRVHRCHFRGADPNYDPPGSATTTGQCATRFLDPVAYANSSALIDVTTYRFEQTRGVLDRPVVPAPGGLVDQYGVVVIDGAFILLGADLPPETAGVHSQDFITIQDAEGAADDTNLVADSGAARASTSSGSTTCKTIAPGGSTSTSMATSRSWRRAGTSAWVSSGRAPPRYA